MTMGYSWENNRTLSGGFSRHVWLPRIHMPDPWFQYVSIPNLFQTLQATAKAAGYGHLGPELGVMRFSGWASQISSWLLVKLRVLVILFCIYSILPSFMKWSCDIGHCTVFPKMLIYVVVSQACFSPIYAEEPWICKVSQSRTALKKSGLTHVTTIHINP